MTTRGRGHERHGPEARGQATRHEIDRASTEHREEHEPLREAADKLKEGKGEHVETDVASQDRIGLSEGHRVTPREPRLPLGRGEEPDQDSDDDSDARRERAKLAPARQRHLDALAGGEDRPQVADRRDAPCGNSPSARPLRATKATVNSVPCARSIVRKTCW